jgi:hypothetical protein
MLTCNTQVAYMAFAGSTGADFIQLVATDRVIFARLFARLFLTRQILQSLLLSDFSRHSFRSPASSPIRLGFPNPVIWTFSSSSSGAFSSLSQVTSPPEYRVDYSEHLLYLPHSYHVNSHPIRFPDPSARPLSPADGPLREARRAAGLPAVGQDRVLLCSYNQFFKVARLIFRCCEDAYRDVRPGGSCGGWRAQAESRYSGDEKSDSEVAGERAV